MNKNKRIREVRVERRENAREVLKPEKARLDAWAVVEVRSGAVLRWMNNEEAAEKVAARIRNGGSI